MTDPKFRVWDGEEMHEPPHNYLLGSDGKLYKASFQIAEGASQVSGKPLFYTGLTDAEGTEVFEGDVVRMPEEWDHSLWIVSWEPDHATYWINAVNGMPDWSYATDAMEGEVVGNRYKNPSLLEAPTDQ